MKNYYSFTVKDNSKNHYPMPCEYNEWIDNAYQKGFDVQCYFYELDSRGRLHMHGCAIAKPNFYKKSLLYKGFHQKIDVIPSFIDLARWSDYIQKEYVNQDSYEQMIISYMMQHSQESPFIA